MVLVDNANNADPYLNLAIEEYLVRNADCTAGDYLLLYINKPCLVLGKNQSLYREISFDFLRHDKLKIARRISGGGTVYQDEGNLNFSFISKFADEKINNYKLFNQPIIRALQKVGIIAVIDTRNNILCNGKKISGNAQFTNRRNIISHGTLLVNADLNILRSSLAENNFRIETKAVRSVSSPVINMAEVSTQFPSAAALKNYLTETLTGGKVHKLSHSEWESVKKLSKEKFGTYEWIYGRSPHTKIIKQEVEIEVENGIILKMKSMDGFKLPDLSGLRYEYTSIKKALGHYPDASQLLAILF